jgi:light-regulated signal transduction histidine kinase (bacteriophytochrome)
MVSSYLRLVEKALGKNLSDDMKTFIGHAVGGAKRMDELILGLLEYSRIGRKLALVPVPLGEAIREAMENLAVAIHESDAKVIAAPDFPTVFANGMEMMRLFQNLIGNAVKYRAPDRSPHVEVAWMDTGVEWLFSVKDNGIGIAPDQRERAFAIFQRLVGREQYEGTGIGLAVCKKIAVHHVGGHLGIVSGA